ncbi:uncharacterized protein LOC144603852 [Rhinoraja longicauda]
MAQQGSLNNDSLLSNVSASPPPDIGNHTVDKDIIVKIIELQQLISRGVYVYSVFGLIGLLAGIYILITYVRDFVKKSKLSKLDISVFTAAVADFVLLLFSITDLVRPNDLSTSALGCTFLSFSFNIPYFYTAYVQAAIFFFTGEHSVQAGRVLSRWLFTVLGMSVLWSALISTLAGAGQPPGVVVNCYLDPLEAPLSYVIVKFLFGFLVPTLMAVGRFLHLSICSGWQNPRPLPLALFTVTFLCRLVYNVMLLLRSGVSDAYGQRREEMRAVMGELVLFVGSCLCLVSVAVLRKNLKGAARNPGVN